MISKQVEECAALEAILQSVCTANEALSFVERLLHDGDYAKCANALSNAVLFPTLFV